ncbi:hypothetical protein HAX54_007546 [Datura stramonium]|uniref:Uncharacterized protein n=1 Tax=Datura stramonium TaxID=4076 RepID=A0ABS8TEM5_DATST|nr:hypothetical protein [Datura stramonium]
MNFFASDLHLLRIKILHGDVSRRLITKERGNEDGATAAGLLEKLSVEDKKSEERSERKLGRQNQGSGMVIRRKAEDEDAEKKDESASA